MNKLDELNRLFASRAAPPPAPRPLPPSSGSVSVSDKLVSTEPTLLQVNHLLSSTHPRVYSAPLDPRLYAMARVATKKRIYYVQKAQSVITVNR